jgi:hypothetical protein
VAVAFATGVAVAAGGLFTFSLVLLQPLMKSIAETTTNASMQSFMEISPGLLVFWWGQKV